jgi:hypothetical protein
MCAKFKSSSTPCIEEAATFLVLLLSFYLGFRKIPLFHQVYSWGFRVLLVLSFAIQLVAFFLKESLK